MGGTPKRPGYFFFFLLGLFVLLASAFGCLYRDNKAYQRQNQRLIILNDSILSVNIELKNQLQQKRTAGIKNPEDKFETEENK